MLDCRAQARLAHGGGGLPKADWSSSARAKQLDGARHGRARVPHEICQEVKAAKLKCYVWTVDSPAVARRLTAAGIDGITTNRPGWMREHLK